MIRLERPQFVTYRLPVATNNRETLAAAAKYLQGQNLSALLKKARPDYADVADLWGEPLAPTIIEHPPLAPTVVEHPPLAPTVVEHPEDSSVVVELLLPHYRATSNRDRARLAADRLNRDVQRTVEELLREELERYLGGRPPGTGGW